MKSSTAPPAAAYTLTLLTGLYVAQGIPYGFFTQALPVLLRDAGMSLTAISLTSLLFLPWTLKFLWGPAVDRIGAPRTWLLPLQLATAAGAALLTLVDLQHGFSLLFAAFFMFNVFASIQDVVTDSLAVRLLDERQRGLANGIQVGAYRIGMVLGGGLLLYVYASFGWRPMFLAMSALLLLCSLPALWLRVPATTPAARVNAKTLVSGWWLRLRQPGVIGFVLLIAGYKFGDTMAASLIGPFMRDWGLSKQSIALIKGTLGSSAGLAGAAAGGWAAWRFGRRFALLVFGLTQTISLAPYALAALHVGGIAMIWTACLAEHLFGGMATVALFTLMMDASEREHAGTDYSLYACAIVVTQGLAAFAGGIVGDAAGYAPTFALATLLSALGCLLLVARLDRGAGPRLLDAVWPRTALAL
ncbi:MAG: transporter [Hydrocarboniphaga sp.]|uniref:MFS transporter n=1 Tax=Hydrocarboniphaga sp. TaxID=2033016 RepID=UPI002603993B|nr:MFS transporter [Hydrocarboniphaga sp.]MDB5969537.1 transporter [Hydrocarboniphaga sp.]